MALAVDTNEDIVEEAVRRFGLCYEEILLPDQVLSVYDAAQPDNEISLRHAEEALTQVTGLPFCSRGELKDVLLELDRRNFLLRDLKWEFVFLDCERSGGLPLEKGHLLFSAMHGRNVNNVWMEFISARENPESRITFDELSVLLCKILDENDDSEIDDAN